MMNGRSSHIQSLRLNMVRQMLSSAGLAVRSITICRGFGSYQIFIEKALKFKAITSPVIWILQKLCYFFPYKYELIVTKNGESVSESAFIYQYNKHLPYEGIRPK